MTFLSKKYLIVGAALLMSSMAFAGVKTSSVVTTGTGPTEEEATASALAKAVSQVNGVRSSTNISTGKNVIEGHSKRVENGKVTTADVSASASRTPDVRMQSAGRVSRYDVQSSTKLSDGSYRVTVKSYFDKHFRDAYKAPTAGAGKTKIAIRATRVQTSERGLGGTIAGDVRESLERSFIERSEFAVLDRQTLDAASEELGLIDAGLTSSAEKNKLKNFRIADIMIDPRIRLNRVDASQPGNNLTGQASVSAATITLEIRAFVPSTSEVLFARVYPIQDRSGSLVESLDEITSQVAEEVAVKTGVARRSKASAKADRTQGYGQPSYEVSPDVSNNAGSLDGPPPQSEQGVKLPFDR